MSQLALDLEREPVELPLLRELPVPLPYLGFQCEVCGEWPAEDVRLRHLAGFAASVELTRIVHGWHGYEGRAPEVGYVEVPRFEWRRPGKWVEVDFFANEDAADANFRWGWRWQGERRWQ